MTPPYAQGNESGYVMGVTDEELLAGLFGKGKRIDDETAEAIKAIKANGLELRLEAVPEFKPQK